MLCCCHGGGVCSGLLGDFSLQERWQKLYIWGFDAFPTLPCLTLFQHDHAGAVGGWDNSFCLPGT